MTKLIILKLDGNLQQGVRTTLSIANEGVSPLKEVTGNLPPLTELQTTIDQWRSHYRSLSSYTRAIKAIKVTYDGSIVQEHKDCKKLATELQKRLNNWLLSESFRPIRETWLKELQEKELARVLIRTSNQQLRQIPWHLWDLVEQYPNAELALSASDYQKPITAKTPAYRDKVKILAILGNSTGIDVETDQKIISSLPDVDVTFLVQPQRQEINEQLREEPWDILFFAGHSQTVGDSGRIYINENKESLTTDDLRYGLKKATSNGLAVAIFNSCDGLGLASELEALQVSQIIVMREQVPDEVAQVFLKHFLMNFANGGKSLYQAAKEARLKLHGLEDKYPCASWLPVICQNPCVAPPCWLDLGRRPTKINPYRGLFAFREEDARFFFGRETFTQMLVNAVRNKPFVAVVGSSGSGKSSMVFAGLVKQLRDTGEWHIIDFRPGSRPLFNLATAVVSQQEAHLSRTERLRDVRNFTTDLRDCENGLRDLVDNTLSENRNHRFLLIADQFEELYTLCKDSQERKAFLDRLLEAINSCEHFTFVITLRADFFGKALSYRPFADALQYADLKLSPMTDSELQKTVEKPAKLLGVTIEEGLTERIVSAVSAQPGDLPLLEFALTQLWTKQQDAQLTHAAYDEIGEVEAALAHYASEVYDRLNFKEKERVQRIFIQLVHPGGLGTEDTRRVANRKEVGEKNWDLVTRLADARLVVTGYDEKTGLETVEIVHEALIWNWGQLRKWMHQDRDFRHWQEQLRAAVLTWKISGCDEEALLRGKPLADAQYWQSQRFLELSPEERSFIGLSVEFRERESNKQKRRRRFTILGLSISLVLALSLAGVAAWQWQKSVKSEIKALSASSEALLTSNQQLEGLSAAIKAGQEWKQSNKLPWVKTDAQTIVIKNLKNLLYKIKEYNLLSGHNNVVTAVAFSPEDKIIITGDGEGKIKLWQQNGKLLRTIDAHNEKLYAIAISPDGKTIASASNDKTVKLWKPDGTLINTLGGHTDEVHGVAFSPDGEMIASVSWGNTNTIKLWNKNGTLLKNITPDAITSDGFFPQQSTVAFSPDSKMIATGGWDGKVRFWDQDGTLLKTIKVLEDGGEIYGVVFHPQGNKIATASDDKTVKLWKTSDGTLLKTFLGHSAPVKGVAFRPDGETIASVSDDTTVKLWRTSDATLLNTFAGHSAPVNAVAFSADDEKIATASEDETVKIWKPGGTPLKALTGYNSSVYAVAFSSDGKMIATGDRDKNVKLWNRDGSLHKILGSDNRNNMHYDWVYAVAISPDGKIIASGGGEGTVKLWNRDGKLVQDLKVDKNYDVIRAVAFSPNGKIIACASDDKTIKLWRIRDGKLLRTIKGHRAEVNAVVFSLDGKIIVSGSKDKTVKLWRTRDGKLLKTLKGNNDAVKGVAISPNGEIIACASDDNTVKLWKISNGKLLKTLKGHRADVNAVVFSLDGKTIASASDDETVKLWRARDGKLLKTLEGHSARIWGLSFSPDGKTLASASDDKTVILRNLEETDDLDLLLKYACDWGREYLKTNPHVIESDKRLCKSIQ